MESDWSFTGIPAAFAIACNASNVMLPTFFMLAVATVPPEAFAAASVAWDWLTLEGVLDVVVVVEPPLEPPEPLSPSPELPPGI